jgi:hypothetical protein
MGKDFTNGKMVRNMMDHGSKDSEMAKEIGATLIPTRAMKDIGKILDLMEKVSTCTKMATLTRAPGKRDYKTAKELRITPMDLS